MLMALFQNKESLSSNKTTRLCGQADKNVQLQARPRGLIGVRRKFNLLLHPIVIRRLTVSCALLSSSLKAFTNNTNEKAKWLQKKKMKFIKLKLI